MAGTPPSEADEGTLAYPGWRVVLVCFAMAVVSWGFGFYGHAFYLVELQRLNGWPTALISSATTAYYFISAVLVAFISDAIRRLGARTCVLVGAWAFAASAAALPFVAEPAQLFAVYLLMAVGWAGMSVGAITNILGLWFTAKRGLAISLALNGASLSGVVVVPALVLLAGAAGFTAAMLAGAAFIVLLITPLAVAYPGRCRAALGRPWGRALRTAAAPGLARGHSGATRSGASRRRSPSRCCRRRASSCT